MRQPPWGIECGRGWAALYEPLLKLAEERDVPVAQVKEKFGGLRFYTYRVDEVLDAAIQEAEKKSFETCEVCGAPGHMTSTGWLKTLCSSCEETRARERGVRT